MTQPDAHLRPAKHPEPAQPGRGHVIARTALRVAGPLLLLGGAACVFMGFTGTGLASDSPNSSSVEWTDENGVPIDVPDEFQFDDGDGFALEEPHFGFILGGGGAMVGGLFLTGLGWGGALTRYQARESLPALRDVRTGLGLDPASAPYGQLTSPRPAAWRHPATPARRSVASAARRPRTRCRSSAAPADAASNRRRGGVSRVRAASARARRRAPGGRSRWG